MDLIKEAINYKYIGMPFHADGFPGPVYSHLMGSNDGLNWNDLKTYNFGWRDVDLHYINGKFYALSGQGINITTDFESFTNVGFDSDLKNCWASELFRDKDGQWWIIWSGGDVDYSYFTIYANTFNPENNTFGERQEIKFSDNHGRIDPNINYINGKYYLWVSITNRPQKLQLYVSNSLLGTYSPVDTNINELRQQAGFSWNEAPEMVVDNGKYYLYCDPWNQNVTSESDRDEYRCESTDLIRWSNMQRCNADVTMRHFTPLLMEKVNPIINNQGSNQNQSQSQSQNQENNNQSYNQGQNQSSETHSKIELWNGNVSDFYRNNLSNYTFINNLVNQLNNSGNDLIEHINWSLDVTSYDVVNRNAYNQFISNANILKNNLPSLVEMVRITDYNFEIPTITIPKETDLNEKNINEFWNTINSIINWIQGQIKSL